MTPGSIARAANFLVRLWSMHPAGTWVFVAARRGSRWINHGILKNADLRREVLRFLIDYPPEHWDIYFCAHAFNGSTLKIENAASTRFLQVDIDANDPAAFSPKPGLLWSTSPGRYQAIWISNCPLSPAKSAAMSRFLAHNFPADKSGWQVTKFIRPPGTFNHKPQYSKPMVRMVSERWVPIDLSELADRVQRCETPRRSATDAQWLARAINHNPASLLRRHQGKLGATDVAPLLRHKRVHNRDRSRVIYYVITKMAAANIPWDHIACLVWHCIYFRDKHGTNMQRLAEELSRIRGKLDLGSST